MTLLGTGYTGSALAPLLAGRGITLSSTARPHSPGISSEQRRLPFDLAEPSTWANLPEVDATVWVFPAEPIDLVRRFLTEAGSKLGRLVAVGTSSSYLQSADDEIVTEDSPLDQQQERVRGEEYLMGRGAIVLRSAGIYGPAQGRLNARNPLDWLRSGRIASAERFVNLIHVSDLALAIVAAIDAEISGDHFIVSDGRPRRWREIASWALKERYIHETHFGSGASWRPSRRLSNNKLLRTLAPEFRHTDLYAELRALEIEKSE